MLVMGCLLYSFGSEVWSQAATSPGTVDEQDSPGKVDKQDLTKWLQCPPTGDKPVMYAIDKTGEETTEIHLCRETSKDSKVTALTKEAVGTVGSYRYLKYTKETTQPDLEKSMRAMRMPESLIQKMAPRAMKVIKSKGAGAAGLISMGIYGALFIYDVYDANQKAPDVSVPTIKQKKGLN
jgi:hypothetical protein